MPPTCFLCLQLWFLFSSPFTGTIKTINNTSTQPSIILLPLIQVRSLTQLVELNEHERKHKGFWNMFKQLKLISSLIQKFCFLKLCKKKWGILCFNIFLCWGCCGSHENSDCFLTLTTCSNLDFSDDKLNFNLHSCAEIKLLLGTSCAQEIRNFYPPFEQVKWIPGTSLLSCSQEVLVWFCF